MDGEHNLFVYFAVAVGVWFLTLLWVDAAIYLYFERKRQHHIALVKEINKPK